MTKDQLSPEQRARDLLERLSECTYYTDPQRLSTGDVVELANLFDEIERLRTIENAALRLAGTFVKRNSTVDPVAMHKLDFALENHGAAHEPETRT